MSTKLRDCPLCGTASSVTRLKFRAGRNTYNISCGVRSDCADTCGLVLFGNSGDTRNQMIEKWNRRPRVARISERTHS